MEKNEGLDPKESKKSILRLLDAIERQRKVLSANQEAPVNVEYLVEDCDLNHNMKRDEFDKHVEPVLIKFRDIIVTLKLELEARKVPIDSVEIIGGATRIPIIQAIIQDVFKVEQVSRTLNASECIARGCAMMAAVLSPLFKVAEYQIEEAN